MAYKDHQSTNLVAELEGGYNDDAKLIKLRRTLSKVSTTVTPEQAIGAATQILALQKFPVMRLYQVDTHEIYN